MRMLDLFCGRLGWAKAFLSRGWECVGIDLVRPPEIPEGCEFRQQDIMTLTADDLREFDFVCASSPCEEFSVHGMKHFHPNPKYPENGMRLFEHTRRICQDSGVPYVMENVRSAQQFVGNAVHHCGPFYLWGNAVPPLMPQNISKGTKFGLDPCHFGADGATTRAFQRNGDMIGLYKYRRERRKQFDGYYKTGSKSKGREEYRAKVATIPPELAETVANYAEYLMSVTA